MTRDNEQLRFVIEIEVTDIDRFKEIATKCVEFSRTEPGTLLYDWYIDEEAKTARLYEAYESVDAVIAHAKGPVFTEIGIPLFETCKFTKVDCFGDPGKLASREGLWPVTYWGVPFSALKG